MNHVGKITKAKLGWGTAQVAKHLPSKHKTLSLSLLLFIQFSH
jgi:hypothetical protein